MGKLIVIEGLDGSGKATQAQLLTEALEKQGIQAKKVSYSAWVNCGSIFSVRREESICKKLYFSLFLLLHMFTTMQTE
ncbi:MAG: hypothetical protein IJV40_13240 [Oscillospiraceae bacterium]|nr:hypothetical protein [Oscillospiraceae bacterium]